MGNTRSKIPYKKEMKIVKHYKDLQMNTLDAKAQYLKYRANKLKHSLWLKSRKSENVYLTPYDNYVLENLQPGKTAIFDSAGYFLEDCVDDLTVIERQKIVKNFYPNAIILKNRREIGSLFPKKFNNFIVTNHRDWKNADGLCEQILDYKKSMAHGCLFFYSLRDTMFTVPPFNRLKINHYEIFVDLAKKIEKLGFRCCESQMEFANGDGNENPDTTNGNIKYLFKCIK